MPFIEIVYIENNNKNLKRYLCKCDYCNKDIFKEKLNSKNKGIYCSRGCAAKIGAKLTQEKCENDKIAFIQKAMIKYDNFYSYEKVIYTGKKNNVIIICPIHNEFKKTPSAHLRGEGCPACAGYKKFTKEDIILKFKDKYGDKFDYSKFEYKGIDKKSIIICPIHKEFEITSTGHLVSKTGCPQCSGKTVYTNELIDQMLIDDNRSIIRISNFVKTAEHLFWKCKVCEFEWEASVSEVLTHDKTGCSKCSHRLKLTNEIVDERLRNFKDGRDISRIENFINVDTKIWFKCNICSHKWRTSPYTLFRGFGCPSCSGNVKLTNEIIDFRLKDLPIKRIGECKGKDTPIEFECLKCGHHWDTAPKVIYGIGCGCPSCNQYYKGEITIKDLFKEHNLNFIYQYSLTKIDPKAQPLRLDFYFPHLNLAIENDGQQHFKPVKFGGISQERANINFIKQKERDAYLRKFCADHNIRIIQINGMKYQNNKLKRLIINDLIPILSKPSISEEEYLEINNITSSPGYKLSNLTEDNDTVKDCINDILEENNYDE